MRHQPSTMSHNFAQVPHANVRRSAFDRSRSYKTTFNGGYLIPWLVDEILPGDTFKISPTFFARLATPLKPVMDNLWLDWMLFFVRIAWCSKSFLTKWVSKKNPGDSVDFLTPICTAPAVTGYAFQSLQDYMGLRPGVPGYQHTTLPLRAYNLIYNDWFRDENLQNSFIVPTGPGPDSPSDFVLVRRGKRHDYFTSCLPSPQKGPAVDIPLGTTAPVITNGQQVELKWAGGTSNGLMTNMSGGDLYTSPAPPNNAITFFGDESGLVADLSGATPATINSLRQAAAVQQLYETDARGGTRYIEILKAHFGVTSPDARLQRPEYLGGGSARVGINPVAQTTPTPAAGTETPQGNLAGFGAVTATGSVVKSFVEHGFIIGLCSVRADLNYQQGLHKMWSRLTTGLFLAHASKHRRTGCSCERNLCSGNVR